MNIKLQEFKNNKQGEYKALEEGMYECIIKETEINTSKAGRKMLIVTIELQGNKMLNGAHLGGRIEKQYILLDDIYTGTKLYNLLFNAGIDVNYGDEINVYQLLASNILLEKKLNVYLKKSFYTDKNNVKRECNKISYYRKIEPSMVLTDEDIPF